MADFRVGGIYADFFTDSTRFLSGIRANTNAMRRTERAVRSLQRQVRSFNYAARRMITGLFSIRTATIGLLGGGGGLLALGSTIIKTADSMTLLRSRLRLVLGPSDDFKTVYDEIFKTAQDTRTSFGLLLNLYARVARGTRDLGKAAEEILPFLRSVAQAVTISGPEAREANAALIQFAQGLASGQLRGEEFRSVAEQVPKILQILGTQLGYTIGQLREYAFTGKLTTEVILKAFADQANAVETEFGSIQRTVGQALIQLQNQIAFTIGEMNSAGQATGRLIDAIDRLRKIAQDRTIFEAITDAVTLMARAFALFLENLQQVGHILLVGLGLAVFHSRLGRFVRTLFQARRAVLSFRTALVLLSATFRVLTPLILVEGFIQLFNFIQHLRDEVRNFGADWKTVAIVAAVDFVQFFTRGIVVLPIILGQIVHSAIAGVVEIVQSGGRAISASLIAAFRLQNPLTAFREEFEGVLGRAYQNASEQIDFSGAFRDVADQVQFSDAFLKFLGLDSQGVERARQALRAAGESTLQDFLELFKIVDPEIVDQVLPKFQASINQIGEGLRRLSPIVKSIAQAFSRFAFDVLDDFRGIGDAASQLGKTIRNQLIQQLFLAPITNALASSLATSFGLPATVGTKIPGNQYGGLASGLSVVGERGPEIVDFSRPARVYSSDDLSAALRSNRGGGGTVYNFNIAPGANRSEIIQAMAAAFPAFEAASRREA